MVNGVNNNGSSMFTNSATNAMGKDDFLELMITQLKYQDPLSPMESNQFATQLAQFSSLEQLSNMNDSMTESINANYMLTQSINNTLTANLIDKDVKISSDTVKFNGQENIRFEYSLPKTVKSVKINIYDADGNIVKTMENVENVSGEHKLSWDFTDNEGKKLDYGSYRFEVEATDTDNEKITAGFALIGKITGVKFTDEGTKLLVDDNEFMLSDIQEIISATDKG